MATTAQINEVKFMELDGTIKTVTRSEATDKFLAQCAASDIGVIASGAVSRMGIHHELEAAGLVVAINRCICGNWSTRYKAAR